MESAEPESPFSGSVLIDNSTYFSAKVLISSRELDPLAVFNLGNFIDSLILADNILLAPTVAWKPDDSDSLLFANRGPCSQMDLAAFGEQALSVIFDRALSASLDDLTENPRLPATGASIRDTKHLLLEWHANATSKPLEFLPVYSAKVFETDAATQHFLDSVKSFGGEGDTPERRLAHYLLRTNVAFELSQYVPYSPHSHRVQFICEKIIKTSGPEAAGLTLVHNTEGELRKYAHIPNSGLRSNLPLALAVVLSGARNPTDITARALDIRKTRAAKRYRSWMQRVVDATRSGDIPAQNRAIEELREAKIVLSEELAKLLQHRGRIDQVTALIDYSGSLKFDNTEDRIKSISKTLERAVPLYKRYLAKRRVAIFLSLARRGSLATLNSLLARTFGKQLSQEQLHQLDQLRIDHSEHIRRLGPRTY